MTDILNIKDKPIFDDRIVKIETHTNVGITSTIKNYVTVSFDKSVILRNAGWDAQTTAAGYFNFCVPLYVLLGFCEDYRRVVINELILIRARNDNNCLMGDSMIEPTLELSKVQWRMPHVLLSEINKLSMLRALESGRYLSTAFRSWDLYEFPLLQSTTKHSPQHRAMRLLSRRYDLTNTGYKFLEIGINVGPPSYVEIVLGDHRGHELSLSLETWKSLYDQRWNIYKMLRNEYKDNFISVGPLIVRVCTLNDATLVRLDSSSVRITMTETTLRRMFDFDGCIDVTFERLARLVDTVDVKYTRFSNTSENAIRDSDFFNGRQLIDCELLASVFNTYEKNTM
ncbi:PREDICTED: uncharacterized protein LOC108757158 [Trachymyrmex septentrionalis]|uniref:uncharacterized protein LOC108757158 n=1 Tax=Trachymyrmex septentrionalis TaxID=34720 RepID=UPI00084EF79E|nr:PREDICTED: uncharacterized protein LOC108757158 [Trachymyrmex septentrionalis]